MSSADPIWVNYDLVSSGKFPVQSTECHECKKCYYIIYFEILIYLLISREWKKQIFKCISTNELETIRRKEIGLFKTSFNDLLYKLDTKTYTLFSYLYKNLMVKIRVYMLEKNKENVHIFE